MNIKRKVSIIAGTLYIVGTLAGLLSIAPAIDHPDFLIKAAASRNQVIYASLFQFIMTISYTSFAVVLFPLLRKYHESLSIGFLSFRLIAASLNILGTISMLLILALSQEFVNAITPDLAVYTLLGDLLRSARDITNHVAMILSHSIAALMLYYIFYKTKLAPRWLSYWGFIGTTFTVVATLLVLFNSINIVTPTYIALSIPMALQELTLAIWLIVKGFNPYCICQLT